MEGRWSHEGTKGRAFGAGIGSDGAKVVIWTHKAPRGTGCSPLVPVVARPPAPDEKRLLAIDKPV
jgi:hypothetical protein